MQELENQRPGRNKVTIVNKTYISGGEYRRKFDQLTDSDELNRLLYQLAKEMLLHRTGTLYEDMYWIDMETREIVAKEVTNDTEEAVEYSPSTENSIKDRHNLLTIHSHPGSFPPSIMDFNSNFLHDYQIGIVVCHNGAVYVYEAYEQIPELAYNIVVAKYLKRDYTESEAQKMALYQLQNEYDIKFKEVTDNGIRK